MGASESAAPKMPKEQREAFETATRYISNAMNAGMLGTPGFGMDLNVAPDIAETSARAALMRTYGGRGFRDIQQSIGDMALTGGYQDASDLLTSMRSREWERGAADIQERLGSQAGTMFTQALPAELGRYRAELGDKYGRIGLGLRERAMNRQLQAAQLFPQVTGAAASQLGSIGAQLRGVREANLNRRYQDVLTRRYQLPFQAAQSLTGAAGSAQYYQPTYGPGAMAGGLQGGLMGLSALGAMEGLGGGLGAFAGGPYAWALPAGAALLGALG